TWAYLPAIFLLPFGMLVTRFDRTASTAEFAIILLIVLKLWVLQRLLKGVAVLFDVYPTRIYLTYGVGIIALLVLTVLHLQYNYYWVSNLGFFFDLTHALSQ